MCVNVPVVWVGGVGGWMGGSVGVDGRVGGRAGECGVGVGGWLGGRVGEVDGERKL